MAEQGPQANSTNASSPAPSANASAATATNATTPAPTSVPVTPTPGGGGASATSVPTVATIAAAPTNAPTITSQTPQSFPKMNVWPQNAYVVSTGNGTFQILNIAQTGANNRPQRIVPVMSGQTPMAITSGGRPLLAYSAFRANGPRAVQMPFTGTGPRGQTLTLATHPAGSPLTVQAQRHPGLRHQAVAVGQRPIFTNSTTGTPQLAYAQTTTTGTGTTLSGQVTPSNARERGISLLTRISTMSQDPQSKAAILNLIQSLVDGTIQPDAFTQSIQRELGNDLGSGANGFAQFLQVALPVIRYSLMIGEATIAGVKPPPMGSVRAPQIPTAITFSPSTSPAVTAGTPNSNHHLIPQVIATGASMNNTLQSSVMSPAAVAAANKKPQAPKKPRATTPRKPATKIVRPINQDIKPPIAMLNRPLNNPITTLDSEALARKLNIAGTTSISSSPSTTTPSGLKPPPKPAPKSRSAPKDPRKKDKPTETFSSALRDDDDVNDVAAMGGVNLAEETQRIMAAGAELVGTQIRSCKDEPFLDSKSLTNKVAKIAAKFNLERPSADVVTLISHAAQERLKNLVERLGLIARHRAENLRLNPHYEVTQDVRGQIKFLGELDRIEKRRHEEQEREMLLRAAKSRSKPEDPEQLKLKLKAKEMQRAEQEEVRQREANETALLAIGPRKKMKTSEATDYGGTRAGLAAIVSNETPQVRRVKRVNLRDLQFLFEHDLIFQKRFEFIVSADKRETLLSALK